MSLYLDNNATTALHPEVLLAMIEELKAPPSNPSSIHHLGKMAKQRLLSAKETIASCLKISPDELFFTASGTEAMNLALKGFFAEKKGAILSSNIEHSSIENTLESLSSQGCTIYRLAAGLKGYIDPQELFEAVERHKIDLIVLSAVNSETGIKNDIEALSAIALFKQIPFVVDAVALLGKEDFTIPEGVSAMTFSAHKLHGPKGIGLLYKKKRFKLMPLISGGGQEKGLRSGTENLAAIVGFAKAVELFYQHRKTIPSYLKHLTQLLENRLRIVFPNLHLNGEGERISNTLNVAFPGIDGEQLLTLLDLNNVALSHGSACSSGLLEPSRVLVNMQVPKEIVRSSLRLSVSRFTTEEEIEQAVAIFAKIANRLVLI